MKQTWLMRLGVCSALFLMGWIGMAPVTQAQDAETPFLDAFIAQAQRGQLLTMDFTALSEDDFTGQSTEVKGRVALGVGFSRFETDDRVIVMLGDTSWVMDRSQNRVIISALAPEEREFSVEWFLQDQGSETSSGISKEATSVFDQDLPWQLQQVSRETISGQVLEKVTIASTDPFSTWETAQLWMAMTERSATGAVQDTGGPQTEEQQTTRALRGEPVKLVVNDPVGASTTTQFTNQRWVDVEDESIKNPLAATRDTDQPWVLPVDQNTQVTDLRESVESREDDL